MARLDARPHRQTTVTRLIHRGRLDNRNSGQFCRLLAIEISQRNQTRLATNLASVVPPRSTNKRLAHRETGGRNGSRDIHAQGHERLERRRGHHDACNAVRLVEGRYAGARAARGDPGSHGGDETLRRRGGDPDCLTVGDIAKCLPVDCYLEGSERLHAHAALIERIRSYAKRGLLYPYGVGTGTGKRRVYPALTVYVAAILNEINAFGIKPGVMTCVADTLNEVLYLKPRTSNFMECRLWGGDRLVYAIDDRSAGTQMTIYQDFSQTVIVGFADVSHGRPSRFDGYSAVTVNIARLFSQVKKNKKALLGTRH